MGSHRRKLAACIRRNQIRKKTESISPASIFFRFLSLGNQTLPLFPWNRGPQLHKDLQGRVGDECTASPCKGLQSQVATKPPLAELLEGGWCKTDLGAGLEETQGWQWSEADYRGIKQHFIQRLENKCGNKNILRADYGLLDQKIQTLVIKHALEKKVWRKLAALQENRIIVYERKAFFWISALHQYLRCCATPIEISWISSSLTQSGFTCPNCHCAM